MSSHWLNPLDKDQPIEFVTAYLRCLAPYARQDQDKRPHKTRQHKTKQHKRCWVLVGVSAGGFGFLRFSRNFEKDVVIGYCEVSFQVFFLISSMLFLHQNKCTQQGNGTQKT